MEYNDVYNKGRVLASTFKNMKGSSNDILLLEYKNQWIVLDTTEREIYPFSSDLL